VALRTRHDWQGWNHKGDLVFRAGDETVTATPDATILALGGASWPKLGSNGAWAEILAARNVHLAPFQAANCGFTVDWSEIFAARFAGTPLKGIAVRLGGQSVRGEAMITAYGIEGGAIYALGAAAREVIAAHGEAVIEIDLRPDLSISRLIGKLRRPMGSQSVANFLRKAISLPPVGTNLLREAGPIPTGPASLANLIKAVPVTLTCTQPIDRAISTAGGIMLSDLDDDLMIRALPGVFAAGEMLDWEAPTGGYLLQACMATGVAAAKGALRRLSDNSAS